MNNNPLVFTDPTGLIRDDRCEERADHAFDLWSSHWISGGNCTLNNLDAPCDLALGLVNDGAAAVCPNNNCSGLTLNDIGGGDASFYRRSLDLMLNCRNYNGNARETCLWSTGSLVFVADADVMGAWGEGIFHGQGMHKLWGQSDNVGTAAAVGAAVVPVGVVLIGETAGALAACDPGVNFNTAGQQWTVYCRGSAAGNLISVGYDPRNGLHIGLFSDGKGRSLIHIPLWPKQ